MRYRYLLLIGVVVLAAIFRLWQLESAPPSPDWDEVALGYNAYSIVETGRDEYGKFLPPVLRSFDDYKPALYAYLIIPFLKVFGLTVLAVRLPSVVFGTLTVLATYFLVIEVISKKSVTIGGKDVKTEVVALISALFLAISPWHVHFSRIAFESNVGVAFNIFAFLFFLKSLKKNWYLPLSFLSGVMAIYVYQSEKVFTPLMFLVLMIIYWKQFWKINVKVIVVSVVIAVIVSLPMLLYIVSEKNALLRAQGVSVFSDQTQFLKRNVEKLNVDKANNDIVGMVLDNRRFEFLKAIVSGYISHFDLNWLFITGDIARHHAPFMGMLYLFEFPFLLIGIYILFSGNFNTRTKLALFGYFLVVPIPAAFTNGVPHAVRTLNFLPMFQIFTAIGLITALLYIWKNSLYKVLFVVIFSIIAGLNILYYLNQYFVQQRYMHAYDWQYGYEEAINFLKPIMQDYKKVVVSNNVPLDQSYMFFLFYLKYDPRAYQQSGGTVSGGYEETHKGFLNITFRPIDWKNEEQGALIVGSPSDFPENATVLKSVYYPNGEEAIRIGVKK